MQRPAVLALSDGTIFEGSGFGSTETSEGEICFHTAMTGYQEIMSDPSYAGQMVCFTFPHVGIVGTNDEDEESAPTFGVAKGIIVKNCALECANYRSQTDLPTWLEKRRIAGIAGIDTRRLTIILRKSGLLKGVLTSDPHLLANRGELLERARGLQGVDGVDLATTVGGGTGDNVQSWQEGSWFGREQKNFAETAPHVVVVDYGCKHNIMRTLVDYGCRVSKIGPLASADKIMALKPSGILLSNGPGDPLATSAKVLPIVKKLLEKNIPIFGICLGHQILALALGLSTRKMKIGHHGANHPVFNKESGQVKITSQNHGFDVSVDSTSTSDGDLINNLGVEVMERSLFDGSVAAFRLKNRAVFGVQYHPEASPGPRESREIFEQFVLSLKG